MNLLEVPERRLWVIKKDSQDSSFSHTELLQQKDIKQIQQKEKAQGVKCEENQEQASKSLLQVE